MTVSNLSSELALLRSRIGEEFDGECHLTAEEAERIASGISSLLERNERLTKALTPFAKAADVRLCGEWADDEHFGQTDVGFYLTFGDLREARAALETQDRGSASHDD